LKRARYTVSNLGHYGLASPRYCHFTSPIRRYPDLQIHRIIKEYLHNLAEDRVLHYARILPGVCEKSSRMERVAEEAEREILKAKKAEFMENKIGEIFDGIITSAAPWGVYVSLPNTVEGMTRREFLPGGFYEYDERLMEFAETRPEPGKKPRAFRIGDAVRVKVKSVSISERQINFDILPAASRLDLSDTRSKRIQ
jgi:ribonuclease R